jgi:hypothetical protein
VKLRSLLTLTVAAAMTLASASAVSAQTLAVAGAPTLMRISSTTAAGLDPTSIIGRAGGTYTITTPTANRTYAITAQLNAAMPTGATLSVTLNPPPGGAISLGAVALDMTARNVITGIPKNVNSTQNITYDFAATAAAGVIPNTSRTVTFTVIRFP